MTLSLILNMWKKYTQRYLVNVIKRPKYDDFMPLLWFLLTNAGVCLLSSLSLSLLGVHEWLAARGIGLSEICLAIVLLSSVGTAGMLLASKPIIRYILEARVVDESMGTKLHQLQLIMTNQAGHLGIMPPQLAIYPALEMNAFVVGSGRRHAMLVVSHGLLDSLTLDELSAVIGHEMTHIANGDMLTLSLMQGVVNMCVHFPARLLGMGLDSLLFHDRQVGPVYKGVSLLLQLTLGGIASLLVMWFSRRREFRADAGGAQLAGHAEMMAALRSLRAGGQGEPALPAFAVFGLNSHFLSSGFWQLFSSHPSLTERIKALCKAG